MGCSASSPAFGQKRCIIDCNDSIEMLKQSNRRRPYLPRHPHPLLIQIQTTRSHSPGGDGDDNMSDTASNSVVSRQDAETAVVIRKISIDDDHDMVDH